MATVIKGTTSPYEGPDESASVDAETNDMTASITINVPGASNIREALGAWPVGRHPDLDIPEKSRSASATEGAGYTLKIDYAGKSGEDDEELAPPEISLNRSYGEEPIEAHPNLDEILKKYKGTLNPDTKKVEWEPYIDASKPTGLFGSAFGGVAGSGKAKSSGKGGKVRNPMYGVKSWLVLKAVASISYESRRPPRLDTINKIVTRIPGYETPRGYNWLVGPPKSSRKQKTRKDGTKFFVYSISYEFILSKPGGWTESIYETTEDWGGNGEVEPGGLDWLESNNAYDGEPGARNDYMRQNDGSYA